MGAGKGHVMRKGRTAFSKLRTADNPVLMNLCYLIEEHNSQMVAIDPDIFKSQMPEWPEYTKNASERAGTLWHKESGYLQELAQEAALRAGWNIRVDGSLSNAEHFTKVFHDIHKRFPAYRIAIIHVSASLHKVKERCAECAKKTGRMVREEKIVASLEQSGMTVGILAPLADVVFRVDNEETPHLASVQLEGQEILHQGSRRYDAASKAMRPSVRHVHSMEDFGGCGAQLVQRRTRLAPCSPKCGVQ